MDMYTMQRRFALPPFVRLKGYAHGFRFVVVYHGYVMIDFTHILLGYFISVALRQSYHCPNASKESRIIYVYLSHAWLLI